jgi:hypothetical protein
MSQDSQVGSLIGKDESGLDNVCIDLGVKRGSTNGS